jgi:hypothetical protein
METYATPYTRAVSLLDELIAFATARSHALPHVRFAQIGDISHDCESVVVSATNMTPDPVFNPIDCVSPRQSTFLVEIMRSCSVIYDQAGMTIPSVITSVSEIGANDGQLLYEFAQEIDGWTAKQPWSVTWGVSDGALQIASLQIVIGIP